MTLDINFHFSKKNNKNLRIDIQFLVFLSFRDIRRSEKFSLNCRPKMENSQLHDNSRGTFETLHRAPEQQALYEKKWFDSIHTVFGLETSTANEMSGSWGAPGYLFCCSSDLASFVVAARLFSAFLIFLPVTFVGCRICRSVKFFFLRATTKSNCHEYYSL